MCSNRCLVEGRSERERRAYDEGRVWERCHAWHMTARHVFECPNSLRVEKVYYDLIAEAARGGRALELGCADGVDCERVHALGAAYVHGIDVSQHFITRAHERGIPGKIAFTLGDVTQAIEGTWDVVFGKAILHHLDYRALLPRVHDAHLKPGGRMVFLEPLGENLLLRLYRVLSPAAHTADEAPLYRRDLAWLKRTFKTLRIIPRNYVSLPLGILSTVLFSDADNPLTRLADCADCWLAEHAKGLVPSFRQAVLHIDNPRDGS